MRFVAVTTAACTAGILTRGLVALAEESTALSQSRISPPDSSRAIDRVYSSSGAVDPGQRRLEGLRKSHSSGGHDGDEIGPRHLAKKSKKPGANETAKSNRTGDSRQALTPKNKGKEEYNLIESRYARKGADKNQRNKRNKRTKKGFNKRPNKKKGGGRGNKFANGKRNNNRGGGWCECDFDDDWGRHDDDDDDWSGPDWMAGQVTPGENDNLVRRLDPRGGKNGKRGKDYSGKGYKRGKSGGNDRGGKRKCKCAADR